MLQRWWLPNLSRLLSEAPMVESGQTLHRSSNDYGILRLIMHFTSFYDCFAQTWLQGPFLIVTAAVKAFTQLLQGEARIESFTEIQDVSTSFACLPHSFHIPFPEFSELECLEYAV